MAKKNEVTVRFISGPGHGWAEVPVHLCKLLQLGTDYPSRGECYDLDRAAKRQHLKVQMTEHYVDDFDTWLDGTVWPAIPHLG